MPGICDDIKVIYNFKTYQKGIISRLWKQSEQDESWQSHCWIDGEKSFVALFTEEIACKDYLQLIVIDGLKSNAVI